MKSTLTTEPIVPAVQKHTLTLTLTTEELTLLHAVIGRVNGASFIYPLWQQIGKVIPPYSPEAYITNYVTASMEAFNAPMNDTLRIHKDL